MPARGADCQIGPAVAVGRLAAWGGGDQAPWRRSRSDLPTTAEDAMTDQQGGDQQAAADMALIEALANGLQLQLAR